MIEYEELCAALDRYVARNGGVVAPRPVMPAPAPQPAAPRAPLQVTTSPTRTAAPAPVPAAPPGHFDPPTNEIALPPLGHHDEPHDPDFGAMGGHHDDDATHVGSSPATPAPLAPAHDEDHNEIDIGDVLSDDEL